MKKIIGIPGYKQQDSNGFGVGNHYLNFISNYGNPRIIMPWEEYVEDIDLLVLPGGMDLNPSSYGQIPDFTTTNQDVFKQFFFDKRLPTYVAAGKPIFGICLGFQQLAAHFGSSLVQNLPFHKQSAGRMTKGHGVSVTQFVNQLDYEYFIKDFDVNCHHHQGVLLGGLSDELLPLALAANEQYGDDKLNKQTLLQAHNIVEAFLHKSLPIGGVQYHPEEWNDLLSDAIITHLLK